MGRRKQTQLPLERQSEPVSDTDTVGAASQSSQAGGDTVGNDHAQMIDGKRRGPRPGTDAARRGGKAVAEKYGREFYSTIGAKGGRAAKEQLGLDFYASIG
ncbi:MAG: hypothetical protein ABI068_13200, partial [Ktedonobacterales bacterium]